MKKESLIEYIHSVLAQVADMLKPSNIKETATMKSTKKPCVISAEDQFAAWLRDCNPAEFDAMTPLKQRRLGRLLDYLYNFTDGNMQISWRDIPMDVAKHILDRKSDFPSRKAVYVALKDLMVALEPFNFDWSCEDGTFSVDDTFIENLPNIRDKVLDEDDAPRMTDEEIDNEAYGFRGKVVFTTTSGDAPDGTIFLPEGEEDAHPAKDVDDSDTADTARCRHCSCGRKDKDMCNEHDTDLAFSDQVISLFYKVFELKDEYVNRKDFNNHAAENCLVEDAFDEVCDKLHRIHYFLVSRQDIRSGRY